MRRALLACLLLLAAGAAVRIGRAGPRAERSAAPKTPGPPEVASTPSIRLGTSPAVAALPPPPEPAPPPLPRGNAALDRIAALELRVGMVRKAMGNPSDEWIRLLNLVRITAEELGDPPASVAADGERIFEAAGFARIRAAAQDLARVAKEYTEAARTRQAASVEALRPAFEVQWEAFRGAVSRGSRRP